MSLAHSFREGLAGFKRAKFAAFASTSAIVVALTLLGVLGLLGYHAERVMSWLQQEASEIEVFLTSEGEQDQGSLESLITARPEVASVDFISREDALRIFQSEFGNEGTIFSEGSFLPASFKVKLQSTSANVSELSATAAWLHSLPGVDEVVFNQPLMAQVQRNLNMLVSVSGGIGLLVLLAALFLIGNTIRLTIYARRLLIRTMKLVGATNAFIRRPFVIEGMLQGLAGGLVAGTIVWAVHMLMVQYVPGFSFTNWPGGSPWVVVAILALSGLFLGWFGSFISAQRFIRNVSLH